MLQKLLLLAAAGSLGTLARFGLASLVQNTVGGQFPWGTMAANMTGCLLAGLAWSLAQGRLPLTPETRVIVMVGFMGAFTTFSAYVLDSHTLMSNDQWAEAAGNMIVQNVLGVALFIGGLTAGRLL